MILRIISAICFIVGILLYGWSTSISGPSMFTAGLSFLVVSMYVSMLSTTNDIEKIKKSIEVKQNGRNE